MLRIELAYVVDVTLLSLAPFYIGAPRSVKLFHGALRRAKSHHPSATPTAIQQTVVATCGGMAMMDGTVGILAGGGVKSSVTTSGSALTVFISCSVVIFWI